MLSETSIKEFSAKMQTTEENVAREYFQHIFLSSIYGFKESEKLAFKGGPSLRIIYGSPRFSEDLDFTSDIKTYHLKELLKKNADKIKLEGFDIEVLESKETTGGFFAIFKTQIYSSSVRVELNVSMRKKTSGISREAHLISSQMCSPYTITALNEESIVREKIEALLARKKPRDYFDLYFILRNRMSPNSIISYQKKLLEVVADFNEKVMARDLKVYVPKNHWIVLSNFKDKLTNELKRY